MYHIEENITGYLEKNAAASPGKTAFTVLENGEGAEKTISYATLKAMSQALSLHLVQKQLTGQRAILVYQDTLEFIVSFLACQYAGIIAVPVPFIKGSKQVARFITIVEDAAATAVLCDADTVSLLQKNLHELPQTAGLDIIATGSDLLQGEHLQLHELLFNKTSFIQYSSGSTGNPKGIIISARNLLSNQELIKTTFGCDENSVIFSWLPFHHDMGLIGNILHTIYVGCACVLMSPFHFMQRPQRWLEGISRYKATHSGGPNFSYDLCIERTSREEVARLDLSSWKVAYNGSEPIRVATIQKFSAYFSDAGFNQQSFYPCYGLAEATLLVTGQKASPLPATLVIEKELSSERKIKPHDESNSSTKIIVSSGKTAPGIDIKIISTTDQHECSELEEGEICISGDSVTAGYWNRSVDGVFYKLDDKLFLRTGDLGFLYKGELFVSGRTKEILIIRGQNYYPYDIEQLSAERSAAIEPNGVAVFSLDMDEDLVIVAEIKRTAIQNLDAANIIHSIAQAVKGSFGIEPYDILLTTPLGIPRTTSGKLQRLKCREIYKNGGFSVVASRLQLAQKEVCEANAPEEIPSEAGPLSTRNYLLKIIETKVGRISIPATGDVCLTDIGIDSLRAVELVNMLNKELHIHLDAAKVLQDNTLSGWVALVEDALTNPSIYTAPIPVAAHQESYPVSSAQKRMWILSHFGKSNAAYNIVTAFHLTGIVNKQALQNAFNATVQRHESLRTVFRQQGQEPRQVILDKIDLQLEQVILQDNVKPALKNAMDELLRWPFDLATGPLIKVKLFQLPERQYALAIAMHHIISDGWSVRILVQEVLRLYAAFCKCEVPAIEPPRIQYKDYVQWQESLAANSREQEAKDFWKLQLSPHIQPLEMPLDFPRPAVSSFEGAIFKTYLDSKLYERLLAFCKTQRITQFNFFRTALSILLSKYSGLEDIVIGVPVSGRNHPDLEDQVGLFVNTLPLPSHLRSSDSFIEQLSHISDNSFKALAFQDYPFDKILDDLNIKRNASRNPLFDVMMVLQDSFNDYSATGTPGFEMEMLDNYLYGSLIERDNLSAKLDLTFNLGNEPGKKFYLEIEYATSLFRKETIHRITNSLQHIISQVLDQPGVSINDIEIITPTEKQQVLSFNDNARNYPQDKTMVDLFREQAARTPDAIAVVHEQNELTYHLLDQLSDKLAAYLRRQHGITGNHFVGIQLERNEWLIIAMLGVLKSGAAYVPIDPAYPKERIDFIIADSNCKLVLDEAALQDFRANENNYDSNAETAINPRDLAYIIYTSGSTGRPKGVMIEHRNAVAFLYWCMEEFNNSDVEVVFGVTSICFDLSIFEIFYTLSSGKKLRLMENGLSIPQYLDSAEKIMLNTVPSVVGTLLSEKTNLSAVKVLNMAGEPIPAQFIRELDFAHTQIRNLYGPSEDTTYSTVYRLKPDSTVLIGHPIANTQVYIFNKNRQLQPVGVPGEICISGAGLARGYLNLPELTAEKFVDNPLSPGNSMYLTGDLGKWTAEGEIEFLGRKDDQVKVRGYRIEPGEIESILQQHAAIDKAVVVAKKIPPSNKPELIAYITANGPLNIAELRTFLGSIVPQYMIPGYFIQLKKLPLTPNGKIDKQALPAPDADGMAHDATYTAPRNETEEKFISIWQEVLGRQHIGVLDNFFDHGGNSLKIIRLAGSIHSVFDVKIAMNELLLLSTPEMQAKWIADAQTSRFTPIIPLAVQQSYPLSAAQRRLWVLSQFEEGSKAYAMPGVYELAGELNIAALQHAFRSVIARHESLRTIFKEDEQGDIRQFILEPGQLNFTIATATKKELLLEQILFSPFDLSRGPLLRAGLVQSAKNKWLLAFAMHHIISDGWSVGVLVRELVQAYSELYHGQQVSATALTFQYKDYAAWQQLQLENGSLEAHRQYWLRQFEGELPIISLPQDKARPPVKTYNGGIVHQQLDAATTAAIKSFSREREGTLFMGLMAAVNALLYRYTGQNDIILGAPMAGREHPGLQEQIGLYINTLALRTKFSGENSFAELFDRVRQTSLDAYAHQSYPFDELVNELNLSPDMSRNALFDVLVVLQDEDGGTADLHHGMPGLRINRYDAWENPASKFDLSFGFLEEGGRLILDLEFNSDIYLESSAERMAAHFISLLKAAVANDALPLWKLDYLGPNEKELPRQVNTNSYRLPAKQPDAATYMPARNALEKKLVTIWKEVLGRKNIGAADNFFALGGHSLKLARLGSEIYRRTGAKLSFKELFATPVLYQQAQLIKNAVRPPIELIPQSPQATYYPLSSAQRRIWVLSQLADANIAYNISGVYKFEGHLDTGALQNALTALANRHESLRTVFREDEQGNISQFIYLPGELKYDIPCIDLRRPERQHTLKELVQEFSTRPFDTANGPLLRACLYQTDEQQWIFCCAMHHIISDGWSMGIIINQLVLFYDAFSADKTPLLKPLRIHYKDYASWQKDRLHNESMQQHKTYWLKQFEAPLPVLELPGDKKRPAVKTYNGASLEKQIDASAYFSVQQFSAAQDATLFMGLLAALNILLYRYTGQSDIIIGTPIAGREHPDLEEQVGLYINTLALRSTFNNDDSYSDLLDSSKKLIADAYDHQDYPFDELVNELNIERDISRSALFDVMIILENEDAARAEEKKLGDVAISRYNEFENTTSKLDLTFLFRTVAGQLLLSIEYNRDIYNEVTVQRIADNLERVLSAAAQAPATPINKLDFLSDGEKNQLLIDFNNTSYPYPQDETILTLFNQQVLRNPTAIAVSIGETDITYRELDEHATRLAAYLSQHYKIHSGELVGVKLERSEWLIIALLATWKLGAAYVPIDPEYPTERIDYIIGDCKCKALLDDAEIEIFLQQRGTLQLPATINNAADLAYVIYTSGSTGRPKGVMIAHKSVNAFIHWCMKEFAASRFDVVFGVTSVCFDLSIFEIFFTLCTGKRLRLLPDALAIPEYLEQEESILLNTVPSVVAALMEQRADFSRVSVLNMAGEVIPEKIIAAIDCSAIEVRNLYGPSEDTTYSTCYRVGNEHAILIGQPIHNTQAYIIDDNLNLSPIGAHGEICLGGDGLALGYLNLPALTAEKFVQHPFHAGKIIYKTGDTGKWLPDGNIEFIGRKDSQVKIRGYRIDPGEIESALQCLREVTRAVVLAEEEHGDKKLVAFLQSTADLEIATIRAALRNKLPMYMMPSSFVQLPAFPLMPNGKIDTARLRSMKGKSIKNKVEYVAPANETEQKLAAIWQEVLDKKRIGIKDNFFEAGGHSLKAAQLVSRINRDFSVRINLLSLFREPTIEHIAEQISFLQHQEKQMKNKQSLVQIEI